MTVTALCPGATESGFQARAQMEESKLVRGKGKRVFIPGAKNRLMAQSVRFLPRHTVARIVHKAQGRAHQSTYLGW